jgi:hypothetical protein
MVLACLEDHDVVDGDVTDEAVRVIDATRPGSGQDVFERLGLSNACERLALNLRYELVDALQGSAVLRLPAEVVFPPVPGEDQFSAHVSMRSCWSSSRSAFAAFRRR